MRNPSETRMCTLDRTGRKDGAGRIPPPSYRYENKIKKIPRLKDKNQASVTSRHDKLIGHLRSYGSSVPACPGQSPCSRLIYTAMITPPSIQSGDFLFLSQFSAIRIESDAVFVSQPHHGEPRYRHFRDFVIRDSWFVKVCRSRGTIFLWGLCTGFFMESFIRSDGLGHFRYSELASQRHAPLESISKIRGAGRWRSDGRRLFMGFLHRRV